MNRSCPCVRMRTLNSASRCLRFSSYEPNNVSIPSSGTVIRFIGINSESSNGAHATVSRPPETALRHQIHGARRLREGDHLANRRLAAQRGDNPIQPERDAAVRRRPVLERLEEEP